MNVRSSIIFTALILFTGSVLFAQVPNISYPSPTSLLINTAVGTSPNPSIAVTNTGGSAGANYYTASTFAGSTSGTSGTTNATGTSARFDGPRGITVSASGNFYVADQTNNEIRKITSGGVVSLFAGSSTGVAGRANATGSSASFTSPTDITTDNTSLFVADFGNNEIRQITGSQVVTLVAGSSTGAAGRNNATGSSATFDGPVGIIYSSTASALFVSDYNNNEIRKVTTAGVVTLFAGNSSGTSGMTNAAGSSASFNHPTGIAVDGSGNLYIADMGNNQIRKITTGGVVSLFAGNASGTAGSTDGTGSAASFNAPTGIAIDATGLMYVYDSGNALVRTITPGGVVTTVAGAGTTGYVDGTGSTAKFDGGGMVTDASNDLFIADYGNNSVRKIIASTGGFSVSPALPAGLSLNATTGAITGTPTASTAPTNYTVTATNYSGAATATLNLNVYSRVVWDGSSSTDWNTSGNWTPANVPNSWDEATFGTTAAYGSLPTIPTGTTINIGSIAMGTSDNGTAASITVNGTGVLNVTRDITYQSDANSLSKNAFIATLAGTGTINAKNLNITANTVLNSYTLKLTSSVTNLNLSGDINLTSTYTSGTQIDNSTLTISGGTVTVTDYNTTNGSNASSTSTLAMTGGTLNFTDPTPLANLSSTGTNTFTLSSGSTIGYTASAAQTVYTSAAITGLPSGISYQNLALSGSGIKTAASGNLNIAGNFTNSLTNDASNYLDATGATVVFNGTTQSLAGGSGNGTDFKNVTVSGGGTKTIASGKINITSTGVLTLSGSSTLAAGGFLTLKSDLSGSAVVPTIPSGSSITGNVNVQRYLTGNASNSRGWRLLSSPVAVSSGSALTPNLTYVHANAYTTGTTGTGGGFDATGNPTFYFYRENMAPNTSSFISGNFRGVNKINNGTASTFSFDGGDVDASLPVGNGFLFFFRGDRATTTNPTTTTTIAKPTTLTATGYLNQGSITVKPWFTGASTLSYTAATPTSVRGFNLVGNPYASSIDWDGAGITKTNIANSIWIYNPQLKVYATYVGGSSGIGTNFNGTSGTANIIPSGQGFFVKSTSTSAAVTFTEAGKVSTQIPSSKLLLAGTTTPAPITYVRIVLSKDSLNREDALIFFNAAASPDYVSDEDADYFIGESIVHISSKSADNHDLAINQLPFSLTRQQIPLNVILNRSGTYTLDLSEAKNIPSKYKIYLVDTYKKDSVDIIKKPVYTFTADTTNATTFGSGRFYLGVNQSDSAAYKLTDLIAVKSISGVSLIWKTVNESTNLTFTIERSNDGGLTYSLLGTMGSSGSGTYSFVDKSPQAGVNIYRLKQQDVFGGLSYTQVSINNSAAGSTNSVGVYPNPAISTIKLTVTEIAKAIADNTLPDYTIAISNSTGNIIRSVTTSKPANWQGDVSTYAPGMYFLRVINNNTKTVVGSSKFVKL